MDICRIGLIGSGNVGRRHAQVLRSFPDVHLAGVTDVVPEAAAALARDVGCRPFGGTGELLSAGVDAVYVCVPPFAHGAPEAAVLSARVPLLWRSRWPRRRRRPSEWARRSPRRAY